MVELGAYYFNLLAAAFAAGASSGVAAKGVGRGGAAGGLEALLGITGTAAFAGSGAKVYCESNMISAPDIFDTDNWQKGTNLLGLAGALAAYGTGVVVGWAVG